MVKLSGNPERSVFYLIVLWFGPSHNYPIVVRCQHTGVSLELAIATPHEIAEAQPEVRKTDLDTGISRPLKVE